MKFFTKLTALLFAVVALVHLYRVFRHFKIQFGNHIVPHYASIAACIVAVVFSIGLWRESRK